MALPTYNSHTFAIFLHRTLGDLADLFQINESSEVYEEVINDTLIAYGNVTDVDEATDVGKLRAIGRYYLWEQMLATAVPEIDYKADGAQFSRDQIFQHIQQMRDQAYLAAMPHLDDMVYSVDVTGVSRNDAYTYNLDSLYGEQYG